MAGFVDALAGAFAARFAMRPTLPNRGTASGHVRGTGATFMHVARRKLLEQSDVMVEARQLEAISLECGRCACRVEVPAAGPVADRPFACPSCGANIDPEPARVFCEMFVTIASSKGIRFRVRD